MCVSCPCVARFPLSVTRWRDYLLRKVRLTAGTPQDMGSTVHQSGMPSLSGKSPRCNKGSYLLNALRRFVPENRREHSATTVSARSTHKSGLACSSCHMSGKQIAGNFPVLRQSCDHNYNSRPIKTLRAALFPYFAQGSDARRHVAVARIPIPDLRVVHRFCVEVPCGPGFPSLQSRHPFL